MPETRPTTPTARETFTAASILAQRLQPKNRGESVAMRLLEMAEAGGDLPLAPADLADALAVLAGGYGIEPGPLQQLRRDAADLAEMLVGSIEQPAPSKAGKTPPRRAAGAKPPSAAAIRVWAAIADTSKGREFATAWRELVELVGRAVVAVVGRGPALVHAEPGSAPAAWLAHLPVVDGQVTVAAVTVGEASFVLPRPLKVPASAAVHRLAHPWSLLGLQLGEAGHGHPVPPKS